MILYRLIILPSNLLTLSRLVLVLGFVGLAAVGDAAWPWLAATGLFFALWGLDLLDGWVARWLNCCSSFGAELDLLVDRVCDAVLGSSVALLAPEHGISVAIYLALRLGPDGFVARHAQPGEGFAATLKRLLPVPIRPQVLEWLIELNSASKAAFFAGALFLGAPVWTGLAVVVPAIGFAVATWCALRLAAAGEKGT